MIHTQSQQRRASFNLTTPKPTVAINLHGAFPKIDRWSSRSHIRERTLRRLHCHKISDRTPSCISVKLHLQNEPPHLQHSLLLEMQEKNFSCQQYLIELFLKFLSLAQSFLHFFHLSIMKRTGKNDNAHHQIFQKPDQAGRIFGQKKLNHMLLLPYHRKFWV